MIRRLAVLAGLVALRLLVGCYKSQCDAITMGSAFGALFIDGARLVFNSLAVDNKPVNLVCTEDPPPAVAQALGPGGACAVTAGDTPCQACARASCCAAFVACSSSCTVLLACDTVGPAECPPSQRAELVADDTYDDAAACLADHCAADCPGR